MAEGCGFLQAPRRPLLQANSILISFLILSPSSLLQLLVFLASQSPSPSSSPSSCAFQVTGILRKTNKTLIEQKLSVTSTTSHGYKLQSPHSTFCYTEDRAKIRKFMEP
ncbi:hypothetical protein PIB30_025016 [Stylosanthes scabra]|uniref:Uncharacterized protein n=1 Tax=Stylosanthes scabra TaxID=79078 RepID=A0ABU6QAU4_9FABA|nr:hypothetical protein [Stylosanthes scabra]